MNSAGYGGSAQRGYEAPACVQNAMVTKDKKPFTYTPGGIDLSQIKSERMAKRLARNAQAEGATGASQQNRPTQPQSPGSGGNAASQIGAAGMGMPFQVLPPPPPPAPTGVAGYKKPTTTTQQPELNYNSNNSTQQQYTPPQPTYSPSYQPLQQQQQQPQYNNITPPLPASSPSQQQPQQQQQSPRPEFRSVAPPQSPSVHVYTRQTDSPRAESGTPPQRATDSPFRYGGPQPQQQQQQPPQQQRAPPAISPLAQQQPTKLYTSSPTGAGAPAQPTTANNSPNSQPTAQTVPWRTQRTPTQQQQPQSQPQTTAIYNNVSPQQQQQTQPASAYQGPKPSNVGSLYIAPLAAPTEPQAPNVVRQFQQQQQQQQARESPIRQIPQQQQQQQTPQQQQAQPLRSTVPWLSTKPKANDQPEWARPEENGNVVPSSLNRIKSPPPPQSQQQHQQVYHQQPQQQQPQPQFYGYQPEQGNGFAAAAPTNFGSHGIGSTGLRLQINANPIVNNAATQQTGPRERIIPIQLEQTPTNTTSQQPNFNVSYGGITTAPSSYVVRSPNQFVDQGYNNFPPSAGTNQQPSAQRVMSPTQQLNAPRIVQQQQQYTNNNNGAGAGVNRSRIIPIAMESEGTRGPISPSPIVLQNDPRSSPIQSKSFRILQKITDTIDDGSGDDRKAESHVDVEPQLQRPQYARQMSAQQARPQPNVEQMRRMQIAAEPQQQQQQSQAPQAWNQDMPQPYIHPSEQQVPEPKKYTGSAIPSRSFKILQAMTTPENAGPGQSDL